jgi:hypothetical protein
MVGEKGKAVAAMTDPRVDYLGKETDGTFYAKHWLIHNGHIAALKERSLAANEARWDKYRKEKEAILQGRAVGLHKDKPRNPPSVLPSKKEGARGAGTETAVDPNCNPRIQKVRHCPRCKTGRIFDEADLCLGDCRLCSQCREVYDRLNHHADGDLWLCAACGKTAEVEL